MLWGLNLYFRKANCPRIGFVNSVIKVQISSKPTTGKQAKMDCNNINL